ncbi:hypothetical protein C1Y40_04625 [Mycobacterium talmoniae]|uniref:Uncharacterized protein n=1 Tax=Mycobacterium talmoniae TaxID=1858794 RepID=A0A2S8BEY9_9MYCO|nr:hypothetical protein C1Y40_04625 [Mycobacterium talmoniae]
MAAIRAPLTEQIATAWQQVKAARTQGELEREWIWSSMLDRLLDRYCQGYR